MKKTFKNILWENDRKERAQCEMTIEFEDGSITTQRAVISKESADWALLMEVTSEEEMTAHLDAHIQRRKDREAKQKEHHEREKNRIQQEELFALKLELFEIDLIKESKNRKLKSAIRKSKTYNEALIMAAALVGKEYDE